MSDVQKCSVMIVDDAFFMRNLLRSILELGGYSVIAEAADGVEAVNKYRELRPRITLMDLLMPKKNGIDAVKDIIAFDSTANVVMCSVVGQGMLETAACVAGAKGIILKPFTAEDVMEVLQKVVDGKSVVKRRGCEEQRIW